MARLRGLFAAGVDGLGPLLVIFPIEAARLAGEDFVGADLEQIRAAAGAALGQMEGAQGVGGEGHVRVGLGTVHVGPGGHVDHQVRGQGDDLIHGDGVADIVVGHVPAGDVVVGEGGLHGSAELAQVAGE